MVAKDYSKELKRKINPEIGAEEVSANETQDFFDQQDIPINLGEYGVEAPEKKDINFWEFGHQLNKPVDVWDVFKGRSLKVLVMLLSLLLIVPVFVFGFLRLNDYLFANHLLEQAKILESADKIDEALVLLNASQNRWAPENTKKEIALEIEKDNQTLLTRQAKLAAASASSQPQKPIAQLTPQDKINYLNSLAMKYQSYISSVSPSLRSDASKVYNDCLQIWTKLEKFFPGSTYEQYKQSCNDSRDTYLRNIDSDVEKYTYKKLQVGYLVKKYEDGVIQAPDEELFAQLYKEGV